MGDMYELSVKLTERLVELYPDLPQSTREVTRVVLFELLKDGAIEIGPDL